MKYAPTTRWLTAGLLLVVVTLAACNGSGVNVGYTPVSSCGSFDFETSDCPK